MTDITVLKELGERLARLRLDRNLTQNALALQAGVALSTLQRLETGTKAIELQTFLRICRALGVMERFDLLIPEQTPSPMAMLKLHGRKRQRASGGRARTTIKEEPKWTWGEKS